MSWTLPKDAGRTGYVRGAWLAAYSCSRWAARACGGERETAEMVATDLLNSDRYVWERSSRCPVAVVAQRVEADRLRIEWARREWARWESLLSNPAWGGK